MNFKYKLALTYVNLIKLYRTTIINLLTKLLFRKTSECKKILVNRDGALGDSIVALPALSIIRQNYPEAQIDLLSVNNSGISFNDIGINNDLISNLYVINKKERKEILKKLKQQNYELFIQVPQNIGIYKSIRNILLVRFYLNVKSAFGWDYGKIKSFMRLQKKHHLINTETQRFIKTLELNGLEGEMLYPLESQVPTNRKITRLIRSKQPVVFLIGGKLQAKKWPLTHWVSLAKLIGDKRRILIVGGENEFEEGEYIKTGASNISNLCGELSIPELRYILENTKIAISLDTGAMHLCDTTDTKFIALFSTRDLSNKWFPNSKNAVVLEKVLSCSFCLKSVCKDNICISTILPNEVHSTMNKLLLEKPR